MISSWTGEEAKALRLALRFSVRAFAEHLGIAVRTISKWEAGGTSLQPRPDTQSILDTALEQAAPTAKARFQALLARQPATSGGAGKPAHYDNRSAPLPFPPNVPPNFDQRSVRKLRERLGDIEGRYETTPSATLLAEAGQCHAQTRLLLTKVRGSPLQPDLLNLLAIGATLLGQLVWDASGRRDETNARMYYEEAVEAAAAVDNQIAVGHAMLRSSFTHLYGCHGARDPKAGGELAHAAAKVASLISPALTGLSWLHVAEARAMCGEYRLCERALAQAEQHFGNLQDGDAGHDLYSPSQFGRMSGSAYLFLGSPEKAEQVLRNTVAQLMDRQKSRSLVLGNLALSLIRQQKVDEGADTLHQAIGLLEQSRGAAGMNVAFGAGRELSPWRNEGVVQDVTDRLLALMAAS